MTVEAYAKVNLTLEVFGKRSDGYHALRSVVLPVSLSDTLTIEAAGDGTLVSDTGYPDDLCLKAARALDPARGARISVVKRIRGGRRTRRQRRARARSRRPRADGRPRREGVAAGDWT